MDSKFLKNAMSLVRNVLMDEEETRSSDTELVFAVWERQGLKLTEQQKNFIHKCYSSETITRCRRKWQEQGFFLPEEKKVEQRSLLEGLYHDDMKYSH